MVDFVGSHLAEGQEVVYMYQASNGGEYRLGTVIGFTEKMVKIKTKSGLTIRKAPYLCIVINRGKNNES